MSLIFKELCAQQEADGVQSWIHPSGALALLVEHSAPVRAEFFALQGVLEQKSPGAPDELRSYWNWLFDVAPWLSTASAVGVFVCDGDAIAWRTHGSIRLLRLPLHFRNARACAMPSGGKVQTSVEHLYLAISGAVSGDKLLQSPPELDDQSYAPLQASIANAAGAAAWRAFVFPAEAHLGFVNPKWRANPFVGFQESRPWERLGLRFLADELDALEDFRGFRIIGGQHFIKRLDQLRQGQGHQRGHRPPRKDERSPASRLLDGMIATPYGVLLLELKHFAGRVELEPQNENSRMWHTRANGVRERHPNPVANLEFALRDLATFDFGIDVDLKGKLGGLVLFTYPTCQVTCIEPSGRAQGIPYDCGKVLIGTPVTAAEQIRWFAKAVRAQHLTAEMLERIARRFGPEGAGHPKRAQRAQPESWTKLGRFLVSSEPIADESTSYCQVFPARAEGRERRLWAKRYRLT
ncbi:MAG TPA: hypothetical protein VK524_27600, partial [Polyangiaceae bacterium]|nr:hypothetical protein [Polyangiaceae bacterium]